MRRLMALAGLLFVLPACQPLYIPPVPTPLELPERYEVDASARLEGGRPLVQVEVGNVIEPAWLAVQWFAPSNVEAASESVWLTPASEGSTLSLRLPSDVEASPGRWRAILSIEGRILRQLSIEVP